MVRKGYRYITLLLCVGMLLGLTACGKRVTKFNNASVSMGTVISQTVYMSVTGFGATDAGNTAMADINEILAQIDETYSWRKDTARIAKINAAATAGEEGSLTAEQAREFQILLDLCKQTDGAFDISLGALTRLWDIDSKATGQPAGQLTGQEAGQASGREEAEQAALMVPSETEIRQALLDCGYEKIEIRGKTAGNTEVDSQEEQTIYLPQGMSLDLGAVAKGIASNQVMEYLHENPNVHGAVISLGGNIITYGDRGDGSSWNVGIVNPLDPDTNIGYLTLKGSHMVITSGDYERFFETGGQRYHHILDPETGYPADAGIKSVTIWCQDGIVGDALSTACFVVGTERALELAEQYEVEILIVAEDGKLVMSEGMKKVLTVQ